MPHLMRFLPVCLAAAIVAAPSAHAAEKAPAAAPGAAAEPAPAADPAAPAAAADPVAVNESAPSADPAASGAAADPAPAAVAGAEAAPAGNPAVPAAAADPDPVAAPAGADAAGRRALRVPVAAGPERIDWYRPAKLSDADANLAWNRSVLGRFDPWTKEKVTLLFQHHSLSLSLPAEEGLNEYAQAGGEDEPVGYPSSRFSASFPGVRVENGNWSLAVAIADATLRWGAGEETGPGFEMRATAYEAIIARGFGAWAIFDAGSPDLRVGIAWPEIYLRLVYGKFEPEILEGRALEFGILGAGISLLGVRATLGDALFAEVRAGDLSFHQAVSYVDLGVDELGEELDKDIVLQSRAGFELRPTLRVGFAF